MSRVSHVNRFYDFLIEHARTGTSFSVHDIVRATGWSLDTARTYCHKQVRAVIRKRAGKMYVKPSFIQMTRKAFCDAVSQKENIFASYVRWTYGNIVTFEFLMPLTREDKLRAALDRLFYRDTLEQKIARIGMTKFEAVISRDLREDDVQYASRVATEVSRLFQGYSISHVSGRFLADLLMTQSDAIGRRYVIDETTALVRFIVPCQSGKQEHGDEFDTRIQADLDNEEARKEIARIRFLFFKVFAEVVVHEIQGEDLIWLLETAANVQKLYAWEREQPE